MKKSMILFAAVLTMGACNSSSTKNEQSTAADSATTQIADTAQASNFDTTKLASGAMYYQCEMHAEVISDKAGSCPVCNMDLSEITKN